jgi:hypothetical protein
VSVGIAHGDAAGEAELALGDRHRVARPDALERRVVPRDEACAPVDEIVRALVGWKRAPGAGSEVLEELDAGPVVGPQTRDPQVRAAHRVQPLLLRPGVLAGADDPQAESVAVEREALRRVADCDRRVIDAQEQPIRRLLPAPIALAGREPDELERMAVGVAEVERADAAGVRVPVGEALGLRRHVGDALVTEPLVRAVHVANDDRHVLEPAVVAARVDGRRPPPRGDVFRQLEGLAPELQPHHAHTDRKDVAQGLVPVARDLDVAHRREAEETRVEVDRRVHVRDRHADRVDGADPRLARPRARGQEDAREQKKATLHPRRSRR